MKELDRDYTYWSPTPEPITLLEVIYDPKTERYRFILGHNSLNLVELQSPPMITGEGLTPPRIAFNHWKLKNFGVAAQNLHLLFMAGGNIAQPVIQFLPGPTTKMNFIYAESKPKTSQESL
jgi:hypothetical protein